MLADIGVDVMLPEFVGYVADGVAMVDACAEAGLPVFLGVRLIGEDGLLQYGETFEDLASALEGHPVDAILIMCTYPDNLSVGLPRLRDAFDGPIGAYPHIGYNPTGPVGLYNRALRPDRHTTMDILQTDDYPPSRLAEYAGEWVEMGAQIVGGCCATGPEHIMAMRNVVKGDD